MLGYNRLVKVKPMPHIPRSMAPSGMIDPATTPRAPRKAPLAQKPSVPYAGSGKGEANPSSKIRSGNQLVDKLSMKDWDVDPIKIMKHLTQQEVETDEHSGIVSGKAAAAAVPPPLVPTAPTVIKEYKPL